MKYISFFSILILTCTLGVLVSLPFGQIPPLAPLLDPNHGFWQNSFSEDQLAEESLNLENLNAAVEVVYDEQLIPHIYAENELDLYRAQGYITAKHRLWQMEFQTYAAAGRLSEIIGESALDYDRAQRRNGMLFGAENSLTIVKKDPKSIALLGPNTGLSLPGGRVCPLGLRTGMSEGIIDELLPWYPTGKCNQFGIKALSLPRNMVPTLVACSRLA